MDAGADAALRTLLRPASVAVIGADDDPTKMSGAPVRNLLDFGFSGRIYPVSQRHGTVCGLPCAADLDAINDDIDTAVIAVRAERAIDWVERCARRGMAAVTIISAGFSEGAAKEAGEELTGRLLSVLERHPIRVLGPNTAGLINLRHGYAPRAALNHFPPAETTTGAAAVICQSGAISNILYNKCQANGVGIGYSVATGDQIDLDVWDFVAFALRDEAISQILCVIEGYRDARRFAETAALAKAAGKPVVLLKLGRSEAGARMVATHSGAMAGSYATFRAVAAQTGIVEAADFDQFWELASLFGAWGTARRADEARPSTLGAFAISGGDAAFIADEAAASALALPPTAPAFDAFVDDHFSFAAGGNPFDCTGEVLGRPELLESAARAFVEKNSFDYALFAAPVFRVEIASKIYPRLVSALAASERRIAITAWAAGRLTEAGIGIFRASGWPVFDHCGRAVRAIDAYDSWLRARPPGVDLVFPAHGPGRPDPFYADLRDELAKAGVPFGAGRRLDGSEGLPGDLFTEGAGPHVLKLNCRTGVHKSAAGLVRLGIDGMAALEEAMAGLPRDVESDGFVLERQMRADLELYLGGTTDADFGKVVLAGFGGRFAEHLGAAALWVGAFSGEALRRWLAATPAGRTLAAMDAGLFDEFAGCAEAAARWFLAAPDVRAFDLNPVLVDLAGRRVCAVDCRIS